MKEQKQEYHNKMFVLFLFFFLLWGVTIGNAFVLPRVICPALERGYSYDYSKCLLVPLLFEPYNWFWSIGIIPAIWTFWIILYKLNSSTSLLLKYLIVLLLFWLIYVFVLQMSIMEPNFYSSLTFSVGF